MYNLPIRYRHYYLHKISETVEKQQEEIDKKYGNLSNTKSSKEFVGPPEPVKQASKVPKSDFDSKASKSKAPRR